jgi:alpha-tubulin suppressor-like RCC1 family protein
MFVVVAVLTTMLTTLSLPAQAASAPGKPVAKLTSGSSRVVLSWVAPASNGSTITAYQVGARKFASGKWQAWSYYNLSRTSRSKAVAYTNGTKVQGMVRAKNARGFGSWSTVQSTVTGLPNAPTSRAVTQGDKSLTVSWGAAAGNGSAITAYRVYYRSQVGAVWGAWVYATTSSSIRTKTFGSLTPGTNYQFYIRAATYWGYGPLTSTLGTKVLSAPDSPTNVIGTPSGGQVALSWSAPLNTGGSAITSYTATAVQDGTKTCITTSLTCTVAGLRNGTGYSFTVTATNGVGTSATSASSLVTVPATIPDAPTSVLGQSGDKSLAVSWNAPISNGGAPISSYTAVLSPGGRTCTTNAISTSPLLCTFPNLKVGESFSARVFATNSLGNSNFSTSTNMVKIVTTPGALAKPEVIGAGSTATINWVSPDDATQVAVNGAGWNTCARVSGDIAKCWGDNFYGQLGNSTRTGSAVPVVVTGLAQVSHVVVGESHGCALVKNGTVSCWGRNNVGQLGIPTSTNFSTSAITVPGLSSVVGLSANGNHTCALINDSGVKCWGDNRDGQLGISTPGYTSTPTTVPGVSSVKQIVAGGFATCAGQTSGNVICWGNSQHGLTGQICATQCIQPPTQILGVDARAGLAVGSEHACSLSSAGTAQCWGYGRFGQLGFGDFSDQPAANDVPAPFKIIQIVAGGLTTCAISTTGQEWCWGYGEQGQLGDGAGITQAGPTLVVDLNNVRQTSTGDHSCASTENGGISCWGAGASGELGDGTFHSTFIGSATPVLVRGITGTGGTFIIKKYTATAVEDPTKSCTVLAPATSCTITGLAQGNYTFTVTATNAVGTSLPSTPSNPITIL